MKKASLLINIILLLVFTNALAIAGTAQVTAGQGTEYVDYVLNRGWECIELQTRGQQISNGGSINYTFHNIGGYSGIDFNVASVASGDITTATVAWLDGLGNIVTTNTMTSKTGLSNFYGNNCKVTISNPVSTTNNITANIYVVD